MNTNLSIAVYKKMIEEGFRKSYWNSPLIAFPVRDYLRPVKGMEYEFEQALSEVPEEVLDGVLLTNSGDLVGIRKMVPQGYKLGYKTMVLSKRSIEKKYPNMCHSDWAYQYLADALHECVDVDPNCSHQIACFTMLLITK